MLTISLNKEKVDYLMGMASSPKYNGYQLEVDLESQIVKDENGFSEEFDIDPFRKESLLKGQDEIGRTLISEDKINSFESSRIDRW